MQVEYEETPTMISTIDVLPPPQAGSEAQSDEEDEPDIEEEEEEEDEQLETEGCAEAGTSGKTKAKRVIKQRQSLAEKQPGTTIFPISRVKKICKADKDLDMMTSEATFMVSVATEYFIKHFMEEGYTKARLDKRKLVTYKDMANVVARSEEFDFLKDVIPMPIPISEALRARKEKQASDDNPMEDDEGAGPVDLTGSDTLPPLAHSTNPLFPNAIVKRPPNTHAKGGTKSTKPNAEEKREKEQRDREEKERKERERKAAMFSAGPSPQTKPYGAKYTPTVTQSLTTRSRRSLAASEVDAEMIEARQNVVEEGHSGMPPTAIETDPPVQEDERMDEDRA